VETALEEELSDHLGYDKHDPAGRNGGNSRNGTRTKTVLTDTVGEIAAAANSDPDPAPVYILAEVISGGNAAKFISVRPQLFK
jgi:hypothetical protein